MGRFVPVVVSRRAAVPFERLAASSSPATQRVLAEIAEHEEERSRLAPEITDALYRLVPQATPGDRRRLLALRRDVFNDRLPGEADLTRARKLLSADELAKLRSWTVHRKVAEESGERASAAAAADLRDARRRLAAAAGDRDFVRGLQLTDRHLCDKVAEYVRLAAAGQAVPATLRSVERTLVSLLYRSSLKPSPYSFFTTTGCGPWIDDSPGGGSAARHSVVRANRALLDWIARQPGLSTHFEMWLNPTAVRSDDAYEFCTAERFSILERSESADMVWEALSGGPVERAVLLDGLASALSGRAGAQTVLRRLTDAGLCCTGPRIDDQDPDYTEALAARFRGTPASPLMQALVRAERRFGSATIQERSALLSAAHEEFTGFITGSSGEGPPEEALRTLLFEDVRSSHEQHSWSPRILERNAESFELLQRLLPLFDPALPAREALFEAFTDAFGQAPTDLVEVYRRCGRAAAHPLGPGARAISMFRAWFAASLEAELQSRPDGEPLALDGSWARELLADSLDRVRPWTSATYLLQFCSPGAVVNTIRDGNLSFFARHCDASTLAAARAEDAAGASSQADLVAVLGMNHNVLPRVTPLRVCYPGGTCLGPATLTLRDLVVRADPARRELILAGKDDGRPLTLTPLNGLHPAAAPDLYRFMLLFAPTASYQPGTIWNMYIATRSPQELCGLRLPRLTAGELVLERRTWRFPQRTALTAFEEARSDVDLLRAAARFRSQHGLPSECFFRVAATAGTVLREIPARRYKPHYLHFDDVLLLRVFRHTLRSADPGDWLTLQECLPGTADHAGAGGNPGGAEEFAVEFRLDH